MILSLIYARSENYCIGKGGRIPWHLPDEFAHFKRTTLHKAVVMGRRTYEDHATLLPQRVNIVVTARPDYAVAEGVLVAASLESALVRAAQAAEEVFVVGGVGLFEASFPYAERVYETVVHTEIEGGDTFVPAFDFSGWTGRTLQAHPADSRHAFAFTASLYERPAAPDGARITLP